MFPANIRQTVAVSLCAGVIAFLAESTPVRADDACKMPDNTNRVLGRSSGKGTCLVIKTFGAAEAGADPTLVVMLHGDASSGGPADYHYGLVERLVRPGVVGVAMLRPGYPDSSGATSEGNTNGRGDNVTPENVEIVASAVAALRAHHKAREVTLIGHSSGANMAGIIMGRHPEIAERALMLSCPCDVARWRADRGRRSWSSSLSAQDFADKLPATAKIIAATGTNDDNTREFLAKDYVATLAKRGIVAKYVNLPGVGHNITKTTRELPEFRAAMEQIVTGAIAP
ncbi:MAG: alpha/beta hydrolase [Alphaproteobacteria bacterium]|nr:alpha/beta hydrolase [Alphaproteobacteria bacterium]